ncbi:MAG: DUF4173 domain-containing protein [Actinomycetota bacterium]|nr:DUF4173 domain-containing protein [Actinomycetota bacterium]
MSERPRAGTILLPPPAATALVDPWWVDASWPTAIGALAFGVATDLLLRGRVGAGVFILSLAASTAMLILSRPARTSLPFFVAAPVLLGFVVLRASPTLVTLDIVAATGLFALGAAFATEGHPLLTNLRGYIARTFSVFSGLSRGIIAPIAPFGRAVSRGNKMRHVPRTVAIVVPVVAVFLVLLGSADAVFGHYLRISIGAVPSPSGLPLHIALIAGGEIAIATLLARSAMPGSTETTDPHPGSRFTLRRGEWILLLFAVDVVFTSFVLVQLTYFFGGRTLVLHQEGLTFAQYARTGFAQLVAASLLTSALIAAVWMFGHRERERDSALFSWTAGILVVLTLVVLVSAFRRLALYESAFGWTWPRLIVHATIIFLGVSLLCGLVWIARRQGRWLATALLVAGMTTLFAMNVLNPDRFIAERNIARFDDIGRLDTAELISLSPDATSVIVRALPTLAPADRSTLQRHLACQRDDLAARDDGLGSVNLARSQALDIFEGADLGLCHPGILRPLSIRPSNLTRP